MKKKLDWSISDLDFDLNDELNNFLIDEDVLPDHENKEITLYCYSISVKEWHNLVKKSITSYEELSSQGYMNDDNFEGDKRSRTTVKKEIELYKFRKEELVKSSPVMLYKKE